MRRRIPKKLAALVVGVVVAAIAVGSAAAALYRTNVVDTHSHDDMVSFNAYATSGGWVNVLFSGDPDEFDGQTWDVVIRNHANQVVYDGPCVTGNSSFDPSKRFITLASNVRMNGARQYHFLIRECSGDDDQAIELVDLVTTMRNVQIRNVDFP
jgi:hypothetical protein